MAQTELPFTYERNKNGRDSSSDHRIRSLLPKPLKEACAEHSFLEDYLYGLPIDEIGIPDYYLKLSRSLKDLEVRNLIYQIEGGLFIHVYPDPGERDIYIPIEPHMTVDVDEILPEVEIKLLDWTEEIGEAETEEGKKEALLRALDEIVTTSGGAGKIQATPRQLEGIRYITTRDKAGLSVLQPLLLDPYIEDISCSGQGPIFIEHKVFSSLQAAITFPETEDVDEFVIWMGEWIKRPVTVRNPKPGEISTLPFVVDGVAVDTGPSVVRVAASVAGSKDRVNNVQIEVDCPGCSQIQIGEPDSANLGNTVPELEVPRLSGTVAPYTHVAVWRVHSLTGDVLDGICSFSSMI